MSGQEAPEGRLPGAAGNGQRTSGCAENDHGQGASTHLAQFARLRSGAEAHALAAFLRAGLPAPRIGWPTTGRWVADLAWPRVASSGHPGPLVLVEIDGSQHRTRAARIRDARRDRDNAEAGWLTLRFSAMEAIATADDVAATVAIVLAHRGTGQICPVQPLSGAALAALDVLRRDRSRRRWRVADLPVSSQALRELVVAGQVVPWVSPRLGRLATGSSARVELPRGGRELDDDEEDDRGLAEVRLLRAPGSDEDEAARIRTGRPGTRVPGAGGLWAVLMAEPTGPWAPGAG